MLNYRTLDYDPRNASPEKALWYVDAEIKSK